MSDLGLPLADGFPRRSGMAVVSVSRTRAVLLLIVAAGAVAGFVMPGGAAESGAVTAAGPDLTRLLRAMAGIKTVMALTAISAVLWRLAAPVGPWRFAAYAAAAAAMAAGPGLIWGMAHVAGGAIALHAGLAACLVLLWRDPGMAARLAEAIEARRRRIAADLVNGRVMVDTARYSAAARTAKNRETTACPE